MNKNFPAENDGLAAFGMIVFFVVLIGLVILISNIETSRDQCLDSNLPRGFKNKTSTCKEYRDGQWVDIDLLMEYNEAGEKIRADNKDTEDD